MYMYVAVIVHPHGHMPIAWQQTARGTNQSGELIFRDDYSWNETTACFEFVASVTQILLKVLDQYRRKVFVAPRVIQQTVNYLKNGLVFIHISYGNLKKCV